MENLGGSHHHLHHLRGYATHNHSSSSHRWRSRSSPNVGRRNNGNNPNNNLRSWAQSNGADLRYDADPSGLSRTNFHSSFHDLHLANEARASRHDLRELREGLQRGGLLEGGSRRSFAARKWPMPPANQHGGRFDRSPSPNACRRCQQEQQQQHLGQRF